MLVVQNLAKKDHDLKFKWPPCPYMVKTIRMTSSPEPPGGLGLYFAGSLWGTSQYKLAKIVPVGS